MSSSLRLGFLGTGWIGRHRMQAMHASGLVGESLICDPAPGVVEEICRTLPGARPAESLDELLSSDLDGLVIATPSASHAELSIAALRRGIPVFCQKPLGRTEREVREVVEAAKDADRLLGVDLSYRETTGVQQIRDLVKAGEIGRVYAINLTFHNAYGPDKPWFYDPAQSGGGCVMDLGVHLVDLALWTLDFPGIEAATSRLFVKGESLRDANAACEDFATARLDLAGGVAVNLQCSWRLPAGADCVIEASVFGTEGGLSFRSVNGSFYDFVTERFRGTACETLSSPPEEWGGRAAIRWAKQLAQSKAFDPEAERLVTVARALDMIYRR